MGKKIAERDMKITMLNSEVERLQENLENVNKDKSSIRETFRISL